MLNWKNVAHSLQQTCVIEAVNDMLVRFNHDIYKQFPELEIQADKVDLDITEK